MRKPLTQQQKERKAKRAKIKRLIGKGYTWIDFPAGPERRFRTPLLPSVATEHPFIDARLIAPDDLEEQEQKRKQQGQEKRSRTMAAKKSPPPPNMFEAALIAENAQPKTQKENTLTTAPLTKTLVERVKEAWALDLQTISKRDGAEKVFETAQGTCEDSALTLGMCLLEVLDSSPHGAYTAFVKENIGDSETIVNRCEYCLRKAKKATFWQEKKEVEDQADRDAKAEALRKQAAAEKVTADKLKKTADELAKKNVHSKTQATAVKVAEKAMKEADKLAKKVELAETTERNAALKEKAKAAVQKGKGTLDEQVTSITKRLKALVKEAASGQPRLDFCGEGDVIKAEIDALIEQATELATQAKATITMTPKATEQAAAAHA